MFVVWSTFVSGGLWRCITEFSSLVNFYEFEGYFSINKTRTQMLGLRHVVFNSKRDFCFCLVLDTWEKSETRSSMDPLWEDQQWRPWSKFFWGVTISIIAVGGGFLCILSKHVAWGLPENLNWLKSVALILVTIDLTSQYKITRLTWLGNQDSLSLWSVFTTYWADSFYSTILSVHHLLFSSITFTDSGRDSPQCSRLTILGSRSRHRRNIPSASPSCW